MAMVMVLGLSITAFANNDAAVIKSVTAKNATVYTNGTDAEKQVAVTVNWDKNKAEPNAYMLSATSADRGIVNVVGITEMSKTANGKSQAILKLDPVSNGKTKVTIKASNGKKKVINVTVKTYADGIAFSDQVENGTIYIANTKGTKVNLGAVITNNASDSKIKYTVDKAKNDNKSASALGIKVDSKGNISVTKNAPAQTVVTVTSNDKKVTKDIVVKTMKPQVTTLDIVKDTTSTRDALGLLNKKNVLAMKGNKKSAAHTYQINWTGRAKASELNFVSSKPSVATVDANGKITAVGNGSAKITVSPKLGNKLSKTFTVKVTTDVEGVFVENEAFTIIANNKMSANIAAVTNANASNKAVKYEITAATADGKAVPAKDVRKYVSVSSKGVVKAKKACVAYVRAYAKADAKIGRTVEVTAVTPVTSVSIAATATAGDGTDLTAKFVNAGKKTATTYIVNGNGGQIPVKLTATVNADASNKAVSWSSNKPAIADVYDDGTVIANGNGTATITATAVDGSGKKATYKVVVKTDAYEINVAKAQDGVVYVVGSDVAKTYDVAKTVAAATNANASNKKVSYSVKNVSLKAGETATVTVTAADERLLTAGTKATKDVTIKAISEDMIATEFAVEGLEGLAGQAYVGDSATFAPVVVAKEEGKIVLNPSAVTLKTSNKNVVAVKGYTVTAKKEGTATISAVVDNKVVGTYEVAVGRNTATVKAQIDKTIAASVKAENRDYTGLRTNFDNDVFMVEILDPAKDLSGLENTGIFAAIKDAILADANVKFESIAIEGYDASADTWERVEFDTRAGADKAVEDLKAYFADNAKLCGELNGSTLYVYATVSDVRASGTFTHYLTYYVDFVMGDNVYDGIVDARINEELAKLNTEGVEFTYDAATNMLSATVKTGGLSIAEFDATNRDAIVAAMEAIFVDAREVTLNATVDNYVETVTKERDDEFIDSLLDEYVAKLTDKGFINVEDLESTVMKAYVTNYYGYGVFETEYDFRVFVDDALIDSHMDDVIAESVANVAFADGKLTYTANDNTLEVVFNNGTEEKEIASLAGAGFKTVLDSVLADTAISATVVNGNFSKEVAIDAESDADTLAILTALMGDAKKYGDLDNTKATVKVKYPTIKGNNEVVLDYTIKYEVSDVSADYTLVWEDNFNTFNRDDWNVELHDPGWVNAELQAYVDSEENIYVKDGKLVLQAIETVDEDGNKSYTSGRVNTQKKHDFKYGRFEAKVKVPEGMGFLPAFWMMPTEEQFYGQWPKCGEIDIMEVMGQSTDTLHGTIHYGDPHGQKQGTYNITDANTPDFADDYHVYTLDWEPGKITWYVDGIKFHEANDWYTKREGFDATAYPAPFDQPFYMIFNVAVGGSWVGYPDETTKFEENAQMSVDYVRVYQKDAAYYEELEKTVVKPAAPEVPDSKEGENLIKNGDFKKGTKEWSFLTANNGAGKMSVKNGELVIATTNPGTVDYSVQLVQGPLALKQGNKYKVSFDAYAAEPRKMHTMLTAPDLNYIRYWGDTVVDLTTEKKTYSYEFDMTSAGDANSRFEMTFGAMGSTATVYIDNVKVEKVGTFEVKEPAKTVLPDGNYVYNGGFEISNDGTNDRMKYWTVSSNIAGFESTVTNAGGVREFKAVVPEVKEGDFVTLEQKATAISGGKKYLFTVDTYAAEAKTIKASVKPYDVSGNYLVEDAFVADIEVGTEKATKTMKFELPDGSVGSDIVFDLGVAGTTYIDNVDIREDALLINGNFSSGTTGWVTTHVYNGAAATFDIDELDNGNGTPALAVNITNTGADDWNIQLTQDVTLEKGKSYKVAFDAWSTTDRDFQFAIQRNPQKHGETDAGAWTSYSGDIKEAMSTDGFKHYEKAFTMDYTTDEFAEVKFTLGAVNGKKITDKHTIFIDNVTLEEIDESEVPKDPVVPANLSFADISLVKVKEADGTAVEDGANLLTGSWSNGVIGEDGKLNITVVDPMVNPWDVQSQMTNIALDANCEYKISFKGSSDIEKLVEFGVQLGVPNWDVYNKVDGQNATVKLTSEEKTYSMTFTMNSTGDSSAIFFFNLGKKVEGENVFPEGAGGNEQPKQPVMKPGTNLVANGTFDENTEGWDLNVQNGTVNVVDGKAVLVLNGAGTQYGSQMTYKNMAVEEGATYRVSFKVNSSVARQMKWAVMNSSYNWFGGKVETLVAGEELVVSADVPMASTASDIMLQLTFSTDTDMPLEGLTGEHTISIDDVCFVKVQ